MSAGPGTRLLQCRAILFDLDGVLVDSRRCIERVWRVWAGERGLEPDPFIQASHGRRTSETLRIVAPGLDLAAETAVLDAMEEVETEGLMAAPGAADLLAKLSRERWAVVTSGSLAVASLRLVTAVLPTPDVFVTGEQVRRGKPDPEPYLTAAQRMGLSPAQCLVVEDAPAGIEAGLAAGMFVIAVSTTHRSSDLGRAHVTLRGLDAVRVVPEGAGLSVIAHP